MVPSGGLCYLKNDMSVTYTRNFRVVVTEVPLRGGGSGASATIPAPFTVDVKGMAAGPGAMHYFQLPAQFAMDAQHVYTVEALFPTTPEDYEAVSSHISLHMAPKDLNISRAVNVSVVKVDATTGAVTVRNNDANDAALYVTLTTQAQGRFTENCFLLKAGATKDVAFVPPVGARAGGHVSRAQLKLLAQTTRVEHVGMYM